MSPWILHGKSVTGSGDDVYDLAKQPRTVERKLANDAVLLVVEDEEAVIIDFAVFEFAYGGGDVPGAMHTMLMHGHGVSGTLRECRHVYWGEDGYTHGLDFAVVESALRELRTWFD